jgi:molybdopterin molybdotransferase
MSVRSARFPEKEADWLEVREAMERTLGSAQPLPAEKVGLPDAEGRALAESVVADATLPPWDNSAMDGYAVRGAEIAGATPEAPVVLPVTGVVRAGGDWDTKLGPGEAVRIMTGAPIPSGADTVIRVEDTDREETDGRVRVFTDRDRGRHVRSAGQDMRSGTTLFEAGQSIFPGAVGVLAAAGRAHVTVHRRPRVAILTTGDELRSAERYDEVRAGAGVPESNGPMLAAMVRAAGAEPILVGPAADDPADLQRRIQAGRAADVLVTVGGASMGEADLVKRVLSEMGFTLDFWRVRMRPGSPISFGWLPTGERSQPVFGLPGNPSSAFVTFELFVRPFVLRLAGHRRIRRRTVPCRADERFDTPAALTYFQRVRLEAQGGEIRASLTGPQISGLVTGLARADGLAVVPPTRASVEPGELVDVMLLDTGPAALGDERLV